MVTNKIKMIISIYSRMALDQNILLLRLNLRLKKLEYHGLLEQYQILKLKIYQLVICLANPQN